MIHPPLTFTVLVGFTTTRPVVVDERLAQVTVLAHDEHEAALVAAQIVSCGRTVQMVTSTQITECVA